MDEATLQNIRRLRANIRFKYAKTIEWKVISPIGYQNTSVFFDADCDKDYVLDALINHDNYPPNIKIKEVDRS